MTGPDDEFDQFLARKRPVFQRPADDDLEPPNSVDRLVLRQAREAIRPAQPERLHAGPGWGVPLAVAATLLVSLSLVLQVVMPRRAAPPEAATQQIAHEVGTAPAAATETFADQVEPSSNNPPPPPQMAARGSTPTPDAAQATSTAPAPASVASARATAPAAAPATAQPAPMPWRGDSKSWLAEIERLRAAGKSDEADAEMALYKRQHRAYAGSPDR